MRYLRAGQQNIDVSLAYYNLTLEGSGDKSINSNLTVQDRLKLAGSARMANYNRNVSCGGNLVNNSSATHIFGAGSYTFTGTTIGGSGNTVMDSATVNFSGSSIKIGDGSHGNGNIAFKNVSFSNASSDLVIGANSYSGTVSFAGLLSMTGSNAAMTVSAGTVNLNNLTVSGGSSTVSFIGGAATHTVSGSVNCGNDLAIATPVSVAGNVAVSGDLSVANEFDVAGIVNISQNMTVSGSGTAAVNNFGGMVTVSGSTISISGGSSLFGGGLTHNTTAAGSTCSIGGTFGTGSGSVTTTINAATVQISGNPTINRLSITNPAGTFSATTDITIQNTLALAKDLDMTGYSLTLPGTAPQLAVSGAGEVIGTVKRTLQNTGTYTFNGEYSTLLIPTLSSAEDYEFKLAKVAPDQQAVTRFYDIRRVSGDITPSSWLYTLGLYYHDSELNGNSESSLLLAYGDYGSAGEDEFTKLAGSSVNTTSNIVTFVFDGVTSFNHRYAIADLNAPLPVELVAFSAHRKDDVVELSWKTATELNNFGFEIEVATEREGEYATVGFVEGHGTKNSPTDYSFVDAPRQRGTLFYRLRQIDRDGSFSHSPIVEISAGSSPILLSNHPNPFNPSTVINFSAPAEGRAVLKVFNLLGETVAQPFDADVRAGEQVSVPFTAGDLPGGVYFFTVTIGADMQTGKMILSK